MRRFLSWRKAIDRNWMESTAHGRPLGSSGFDGARSRCRLDPSRSTARFRRSTSSTTANADCFIAEAKRLDPRPTILVIGGGTIGSEAEALYRDTDPTLIGMGIYKSDLTLIIADGRQFSLASGAINGVWIQAVLERPDARAGRRCDSSCFGPERGGLCRDALPNHPRSAVRWRYHRTRSCSCRVSLAGAGCF